MEIAQRIDFRTDEKLPELGLEGASTTTAFHCVGILESEALLLKAVVPINGCTVEIQSTLFINNNSHAVTVVLAVSILVEAVVEV